MLFDIKDELHEFKEKSVTRQEFHNVMDPVSASVRSLDAELIVTTGRVDDLETPESSYV